ncbi:hypothetical protein AAT19DRAFT_10311 [Rhodotorula toruloides]|uniref:Uncharacterized protein n=1 Tax=Rhodotorula toruloides TaxID=5286 RepID=A0A2T0A0F2_RHOTO|nr:hypothetical protein AAT19DRAFT_10311 [Rhodotorula toruloides]
MHADRLQVMGAREGAIKGTLVAGTLMALAQWRYPWVQKQTLAGKAFLVMWGTIFGVRCEVEWTRLLDRQNADELLALLILIQMVTYAGASLPSLSAPYAQPLTLRRTDHYLLQWEAEHRMQSERWRTQARSELAAQGTVPSESAMRAWKTAYDSKLRSTLDSSASAPASAPAGQTAEGRSQVLQELELAKQEKTGGVDRTSA